jgi:hypothetical protein
MTINSEIYTADIETVYGLPEFDALDYQSDLFIKVLDAYPSKSTRSIVCINPGQGHLPTILSKMYKPDKIILVSRDLLSLRNSTLNLDCNGFPIKNILSLHQVDWALGKADTLSSTKNSGKWEVDLVAVNLRSDEGQNIVAESVSGIVDDIKISGMFYVAGGSTPITRLLKNVQSDKRLLLKKRRKHHGRSVAVFQRRQ